MGTPHRGSADMAALGDIARRIASLVLMDNNSNVLDALGLKTSDLERCQDSFTSIWGTYDFRVKTFQEGQPLTGINLGQLKEKVYASILLAESLLNKMNCRLFQISRHSSEILGSMLRHYKQIIWGCVAFRVQTMRTIARWEER